MNDEDRIKYFRENFIGENFTRKDYMNMFLTISGPTASRDLKKAVDLGFFIKFGNRRITSYKLNKNYLKKVNAQLLLSFRTGSPKNIGFCNILDLNLLIGLLSNCLKPDLSEFLLK